MLALVGGCCCVDPCWRMLSEIFQVGTVLADARGDARESLILSILPEATPGQSRQSWKTCAVIRSSSPLNVISHCASSTHHYARVQQFVFIEPIQHAGSATQHSSKHIAARALWVQLTRARDKPAVGDQPC